MGVAESNRLRALEAKLGVHLPATFVSDLTDREPIREGTVAIVTADRVWDVRTTFSLDAGRRDDQLDRVYDLIGDVLPPGALPFAVDWGGNFYCLMLSGPLTGRVVWWDHERDADDHRVETLAGSVTEFFARLVPDPR